MKVLAAGSNYLSFQRVMPGVVTYVRGNKLDYFGIKWLEIW